MLFVLQLGSCSGSDIPQGGRRGGNCGGTCAHGGHDIGFVPQQAACNDRHLCAGADLGDDPGHDAGKDLDKIRLALLQLAGQAGQREGIQDECPLDGQQAAVARRRIRVGRVEMMPSGWHRALRESTAISRDERPSTRSM